MFATPLPESEGDNVTVTSELWQEVSELSVVDGGVLSAVTVVVLSEELSSPSDNLQ